MTPATVTKTIIGRSVNFTPGTVNTAFPIKVNGTAENITITTTSGSSVNDATTGNATFLWVDDTGGNGHLQITITGDSTSLEFENNNHAEAIGLKTAEILAYVKGEEIELETTNGQGIRCKTTRLAHQTQVLPLKILQLRIYLLRS